MRETILRFEASVGEAVVGQAAVVRQILIALLADGHVLLESLPGLAKTRTVKAIAERLAATMRRIQFTPDLLPSDITGGETLLQSGTERTLTFQPGPIFGNLILADEINRAPAKVQSALLEAMEERQVSVAGKTHPMPELFLVMATQNPIEQEGTYPLPEAQLDRFLLAIDISYPEIGAERAMLVATTGADTPSAEPVMTPENLMEAQALIRRMPVGEAVVDAILTMVRGGRPESTDLDIVRHHVAWGPGPRAAQALMLACRASAILGGRLMPSLDDVAALAGPVLRHRMALNFSARADGVALDEVIDRLVERLG